MKIVVPKSPSITRTFDEYSIPDSILRVAEQFDSEDPVAYSGDYPRHYEFGGWPSRNRRKWDKTEHT